MLFIRIIENKKLSFDNSHNHKSVSLQGGWCSSWWRNGNKKATSAITILAMLFTSNFPSFSNTIYSPLTTLTKKDLKTNTRKLLTPMTIKVQTSQQSNRTFVWNICIVTYTNPSKLDTRIMAICFEIRTVYFMVDKVGMNDIMYYIFLFKVFDV